MGGCHFRILHLEIRMDFDAALMVKRRITMLFYYPRMTTGHFLDFFF